MNNAVYLQREFSCDAEVLYQWLTQPQLIAQWFGPEQLTVIHVSNSIEIGGNYSIELKKADGLTFYIEGKYIQLISPSLIEFSLKYLGLPSTPPKSIVTMKLGVINPGLTQLNLKQVFEFELADMESRTKGWEYMLGVLESFVAMR